VLFLFDGFAVLFFLSQIKPKDSADVYQNIQTYSKKNKFTKILHRVIFKSNNSRTKKQVVKLQQRANVEGKVIRNISIVTLALAIDIDTTVNPKIGQNEQETDYT
jgi:predicted nucleotidyltransferase component of viral defense system